MKLRRLYSNQPKVFVPIVFRDGLNVVKGEIRKPENRTKDTHNLGKTILAQVIDFCLLRQKNKEFFLFKHEERFADFVFFLEVETDQGDFVTVRRSVENGSKASFKKHKSDNQDFSDQPEGSWDHWETAFETARQLLDGMLGLKAISPWTFRNAIAYSLRSQKDYDTPFKLAKFAGRHRDWKPLLAHILGLNADLFDRNYELIDEIAQQNNEVSRQRAEALGIEGHDQLSGLISIREEEVRTVEEQVQRYDFELADAEINRELVDDLDTQVADLNQQRYYLDTARKRTEAAIGERIVFDLNQIKTLFAEAKVYFGDQLTRDYAALVAFNEAITEERNAYLADELSTLVGQLKAVREELSDLNAQRSAALLTLNDTDALSRYRRLNERLVDSKATLESLRRQEASVEALLETRRKLSVLEDELDETREEIQKNIKAGSERYKVIRKHFNEVVSRVIDDKTNANLYVGSNLEGNPDFHADLVDKTGKVTGEAEGHSYGRLLCIAFDMSVQRAYVQNKYPHFVYHDGVLESLDDRKKLNLIEMIREYADTGYQHIVTLIDSELPTKADGTQFDFDSDEVILTLHDDGQDGRLFRMPMW